jgi:hypothetical protein
MAGTLPTGDVACAGKGAGYSHVFEFGRSATCSSATTRSRRCTMRYAKAVSTSRGAGCSRPNAVRGASVHMHRCWMRPDCERHPSQLAEEPRPRHPATTTRDGGSKVA